MESARPIGVFDSGVGGLTVLHECLVTMPHEDFVYVGDTGRFPYGGHTLDELRGYALEIGAWLEAQGIKLLVVACNSATAAALPDLQRQLAVPVMGVVGPEARAAVQATRARRVGVLATEATVSSRRYRDALLALDAGLTVIEVPCPGLADRIQDGDPYDDAMVRAVRECCEPLRAQGVDTAILGCTHYPLIRPMFQRELGRGVALITGAEELAGEVAATLARRGLARADTRRGSYRFACTGDPHEFALAGRRFLQFPLGTVRRLEPAELGHAPAA